MTSQTLPTQDKRAVVAVRGLDAERLLQGLITNELAALGQNEARYAALLGPQGKVQFDFFAVGVAGGFDLDVAADCAAGLIDRLIVYRLRAKADIGLSNHPSIPFTDPRVPQLGERHTGKSPAGDYDARRIALGVPECSKDYAPGELFPHEAMLDQLNGVSFTKGCYVGQEIVSRMQHRGTARSRFLIADADIQLPPLGTPVTAGETPLGQMGSNAGRQGLALIRLDRLADAYAAKTPVTAGGVPITLTKPAYATFEVPSP